MNAPIILFVYKRLAQTKATLEALQHNVLASESDLFVYADGAKSSADQPDVMQLRAFLATITGFRSVTIRASDRNLGLAASIVKGVSEIVNRYGRAIVLEDDIVTSPYFLLYMNEALELYADDEQVMSISGYMYPHRKQLSDTFFFNVPLCWGWATWKRAWIKFNDTADFHIRHLNETKGWRAFNKFGGQYLERQLRKNARGKMNTWFIYWHATLFYHNGFCLFPGQTLVNNIGFDSSGEHGALTNQYYSPLCERQLTVDRQPLLENEEATRTIRHFYRFKVNRYWHAMKKLVHKMIG